MTTAPHQRNRNGAFTNANSADTVTRDSDGVTWIRIPSIDETAGGDTLTNGVRIGRCDSVSFHLGTVNITLATNDATFEIQAGNPDGTWNDIGTQLVVANATDTMDVVTIYDPPELLRLELDTTAQATTGDINFLIEAHPTNY